MAVVRFVIHAVQLPDVLDKEFFMKIIVFGTKICKFCKVQKGYLKESFNNKDWLYVDVSKGIENLRIASSINIDKLPTIVLLDDKNKEIYRKEGTLSADRIFDILNYGNKENVNHKSLKIPVIDEQSNKAMLTYDPFLSKGDSIQIYKFNGVFLGKATVTSSERVNMNESKINDQEKQLYLKIGGRKDFCWIVKFRHTEGDKETA